VIARVMAAYWARQDKAAATAYARLMAENRAMMYGMGRRAPADWEWDVRVATARKARTHTMMTKWANRAAGRGR
jgi:hypothetical protein